MAESNLYTSVMSTLDPSHATVSVHESDGVSMQSGRLSAYLVAVITANGEVSGPLVKAKSIGKNCGGTAPKRTRWRVVESELGFNESSLAPSSGPMSMSLSAWTPSTVFACMFTRETREPRDISAHRARRLEGILHGVVTVVVQPALLTVGRAGPAGDGLGHLRTA
eukprot:scaffold24838_cov66-Phaeocystis_antarctica.AAC.2